MEELFGDIIGFLGWASQYVSEEWRDTGVVLAAKNVDDINHPDGLIYSPRRLVIRLKNNLLGAINIFLEGDIRTIAWASLGGTHGLTDEEIDAQVQQFRQEAAEIAELQGDVKYGVMPDPSLIRSAGALRNLLTRIPKRAVDPKAVVNLLSSFRSRRYIVNGLTFVLDKKGLQHILERHHPSFWNGTTKASQSFFPKNMSISEIENAISEVLKQNPTRIAEIGVNGRGAMEGVVNGVRYQLGLFRGRIAQFFPILE
jgi:hypothetical protein